MSGRQYLPLTDKDRQAMLAAIGADSVEDLFREVPEQVRRKRNFALPPAMSEPEMLKFLEATASANLPAGSVPCFLGGGAYDHFVPSVVPHLVYRSEFYTAYTPYQPEISQGGLQALWEYQSFICELTGLDAANSSLYDGATALAEAVSLACGFTGRREVVVSDGINPLYRKVLETYARDLGFMLIAAPLAGAVTDVAVLRRIVAGETAAVLIQNPNFFGAVETETLRQAAALVHEQNGLCVACVNPIAAALLASPGECGADIAVGEGQPLGLGLNFGGPYLGFMAVRERLLRRMPGRIVGMTADREGKRGFVLTLQAREQHIRREKAYSNICSNEGLCALTAAVYLATVGRQGLRKIASLCTQKAHYLAARLAGISGYSLGYEAPFFHEFVLKLPKPAAEINAALLRNKIIGGLDLGKFFPDRANEMLLCVTEKRTRQELDGLVAVLEGLQ